MPRLQKHPGSLSGAQLDDRTGLQPVASTSKGAGDVLAQHMDSSPTELGGAAPGVTFERVAPCLLPEEQQVP